MKVVALVSGGKDSCYNIVQAIKDGHEIVALGNLYPENKEVEELDSYMYQTVGHGAIDLYAEAFELPLYREPITGSPLCLDSVYQKNEKDEVEDLFRLLTKIKKDIPFDAVASGAIFSNYQRVRIEDICSRMGLKSLTYLWERNQRELLQEMISCPIEAIVVKVATLGLDESHLGKTIAELQPHLLKMADKFGINVCGEGGEYETFTLNCPLFKKKLVLKETEVVPNGADVYHLLLKSLVLQDKKDGN
ncbi:diphthine--ammonia ligase [Lepeophtheirus salmonis]|nr:diphthine--ammonia ligase-like [Lepeophtheirus salmonis]XP_040568600.1 diphthine--ammonia ligase-like [Lepeophtheirus salmonis]